MATTSNRIIRKIETIMTGEEEKKLSFLSLLLFVVSIGYGSFIKLRGNLYKENILQSKTLPCPVISIGNITVGGSGKTPMTIYLAKFIMDIGCRVVVISRGYKGKAEKIGGVVSDGHMIYMGPDEAGDEPFMIAKRLKTVPVIVGQDRYKAGVLAIKKFNPDVILLDDAFQHLAINRDIDLVLLDSKEPFGNNYLFPRGTLRETPSALKRGDAVILTRLHVENLESLEKIKRVVPEKPIFYSVHKPYIYKIITRNNLQPLDRFNVSSKYDFEIFNNKRVLAFSGIANNDAFRRTIEGLTCKLIKFSEFPDHHPYSNRELNGIVKSAMDLSVAFILTTEKDYMRIIHKIKWPIDLVVIGVEISFEENDYTFKSFIKSRIEEYYVEKR